MFERSKEGIVKTNYDYISTSPWFSIDNGVEQLGEDILIWMTVPLLKDFKTSPMFSL